ncbi:MAG: response regulator [Actinomycetota bacterium]|nr:response regulator [Actinomycetota bacterium]
MKKNGAKIRIVIVDDIVETNHNLAKLIAFEPDMEVVGQAFNGGEALLVAPPAGPDIVLMDIYMPVMDGITATALLTKTPGWTAPVVMMSVNGEQDFLRRAELSGARGYLVKPFSADELIDAIRRVHSLQSDSPAARTFRADVIQEPQRGSVPESPARETTVVDLMAALRASVEAARTKDREDSAGPLAETDRVQPDPPMPPEVASPRFQSPESRAARAARAEVTRSQRRGLLRVGTPPSPGTFQAPLPSPSPPLESAAPEGLKHSYDGRGKSVIASVVGLVKRFPIWTAIAVFALGGYLFRDFLSGNVGDLKVGDCFDPPNLTAADTLVKDVQHHPCGDLHGGEVFFVGNVPSGANGAFPGEAAFAAFVQAQCVPAYRNYTGRDFDTDTTYDVSFLVPTTEGWAKGDHVIDCFVLRIDGQPLKGSVKAAR